MSRTYSVPVLALRIVKERTAHYARARVNAPDDVVAIAQSMIGDSPIERLIAIMIDNANNVTSVMVIGQGGMSGVHVAPRDVFRAALVAHASAIVLAHNHPSNSAEPSGDDLRFQRKIESLGADLGIQVLDHLIVTRSGGFTSLRNRYDAGETPENARQGA